MEKEFDNDKIQEIVDKIEADNNPETNITEQSVPADASGLVFENTAITEEIAEETSEAEQPVAVEEEPAGDETAVETESQSEDESEQTEESKSEPIAPQTTVWTTYVPRFTEASENYRLRGDAEIRARLNINAPKVEEEAEDDVKIDPTAEYDEDIHGSKAKTPENLAAEESDESLNIFKFTVEDDFMDELDGRTAEEEMAEIAELLKAEPKDEPIAEPEVVEPVAEISEEIVPEEEYVMPDPDADELGVYECSASATPEEPEDAPSGVEELAFIKEGKAKDSEFNNPAQRDSIKDRFLDSIISIKIRFAAASVFAVALLIFEILCACGAISFNMFPGSAFYASAGLVDFLLSACVLVMALPEIIRSVKSLIDDRVTKDLAILPIFLVFLLYTVTLTASGARSYTLFGFLFAVIALPVLSAALFRTKADFIAFKMVAHDEEKQIIDRKNTRELGAENIALDGVVDEFKSKTARTFRTSFVSDFFKSSSDVASDPKHFAFIFGIPLAIGFITGLAALAIAKSAVVGMAAFTFVFMLGCPAFSILSSRVGFFFSQRAALIFDSTAIGENAYHNFSSVDVFAFDDTDMFGPDDVNLKRFMTYGERDNMEKVMRQMSALFAAVGGPLDYMFSNAIDNRVRHKTATNLIIEDDGICGTVAGHRICAGSKDYMVRNGIALPDTSAENELSIDTTKIMYAAEDGEVYAKFYIRYSFSEEFTATLPSLRENGITPLVYTRDPNISNELLVTLTAGSDCMRVVKLYSPVKEEKLYNRVKASMITYGDRLDAASMIVLAKKYNNFAMYAKFAELCGMAIGIILAVVLTIVGFSRLTVLVASAWHIVWCLLLRAFSNTAFLQDAKKKEE